MAVRKLSSWHFGGRAMTILEPVFNLLLLIVATAYFVDGSFSAFLYFRF
jgi:hypothetical protein